MSRFSILGVVACALTLSAGAASAQSILGTWQTEPDGKDQVGHVQVRACGAAFCGRIVSAYDSAGNSITTPNVGRELFWDLRNVGGETYDGGRIYVPTLGADFPVEMSVQGGTLRLKACNAVGICRNQSWRRVN